jgi:transcriptional regulator with GAF, ATPase, and Fis domain
MPQPTPLPVPDIDDFLEAGLAWLEGVTPYDLATVWQVDGAKLRVRAARGRLKSRTVMRHEVDLGSHSDLRRVLEGRVPRVNTEHDHSEGEGDLFDGVIDLTPGHSCMVVPLYSGQETLGLLSLDRNVCESYTSEAMRLVDLYARILAFGLSVTQQAHELQRRYQQERSLSEMLAAPPRLADPVDSLEASRNKAMAALVAQAKAVASTDSAVLLLGETGTGKEVLAAAVHRWSARHAAPLVKLNCASIPEGTLESELFGHVKGAFTGALRDRDGRFRAADGGSLFLDEIGELPMTLQAKLLRVLQEGTFEPVGSDKTVRVDVRIIAATNVDLEAAIRAKQFREDLYYRINVFPLRLPPLRERTEDLPRLVESLLNRFRPGAARAYRLDDAAWAALGAYHWPGNVRELSNVLERALILAGQAGSTELGAFLPDLRPAGGGAGAAGTAGAIAGAKSGGEPVDSLDAATKRHIERALAAAGGHIYGESGAAALLGVKPSTLQSKMKKLGVARRG